MWIIIGEHGELTMRARVSKWGNSLALRLPKAVVESLGIAEGQAVTLRIEGQTVLIRPPRPHYELAELVEQMRPNDKPETIDDAPVGTEIL